MVHFMVTHFLKIWIAASRSVPLGTFKLLRCQLQKQIATCVAYLSGQIGSQVGITLEIEYE